MLLEYSNSQRRIVLEQAAQLTASLEDYLETIYELVRDRKLARVKDIAQARGVQAGSVSPAMKRLSGLGLIRYVRRDYIDLTPLGVKEAQRVYARHQMLTRLFREVLRLSSSESEKNACAMEHNLTEKAMDRLVRFFEFVDSCPDGKNILEVFHQCSHARENGPDSTCQCETRWAQKEETVRRVSDLSPGEGGTVTHVDGSGAIRQRLLDMGILPGVPIDVERVAPAGDPMWIRLQGFQLSLRRAEADAIAVDVNG
jgi:DtxR family Mn-dependent transcriptional regulator